MATDANKSDPPTNGDGTSPDDKIGDRLVSKGSQHSSDEPSNSEDQKSKDILQCTVPGAAYPISWIRAEVEPFVF